MKQLKILSLATGLALACASSTFATTWNLTFTSLGPAKVVGINYNHNRAANAGAVSNFSYYWSGQMRWHNNQDGRNLTTFCTQINEHIGYNQTVSYQEVAVHQVPDSPPAPGPMGLVKATILRDLYSRFYHTVRASNDGALSSAFQLVVWEISHENVTANDAGAALGQLNLFAGALQVNGNYANSGNAVSLATSMLAELGGANDNDFRSFNRGDALRGLRHDTAQDQLLVVPLPTPLAFAAAGLVGVVIRRRRNR